MIRPLTCLCMLLAGGSGLYLYQEKHRTSLLDREITRTLHASEAAHERTGLLRAEWALLNEPGRLQELADRFLSLHAMSPSQFVPVAELARRLPAPAAPPAADGTDLDPAVLADARPSPAQPPDAAPSGQEPGHPAAPRGGLAFAAASGETTHADPAPRPAAAPRAVLAAAPAEARSAGPSAATPHPARLVQAEARQERRPEPAATALPPASTPPRSYAAAGVGPGAGYAGGRALAPVMAPVLSGLATPMAHPRRAEPLLTRAAATMPLRPAYAPPGLPAQGAYSGSLLGGGRASLPPPVPMGAGAQ